MSQMLDPSQSQNHFESVNKHMNKCIFEDQGIQNEQNRCPCLRHQVIFK